MKKSRDYPEHALVDHQPIDLLFRNVSGPLHKVVDLKEDFSFALLHFKELCGHGGQADVGECVELLAAKVAAAKLKLQITAQKKVVVCVCGVLVVIDMFFQFCIFIFYPNVVYN